MGAVRLFLVAFTETDDPASVYRVPEHSRWQNTEASVRYFLAGKSEKAGSDRLDLKDLIKEGPEIEELFDDL